MTIRVYSKNGFISTLEVGESYTEAVHNDFIKDGWIHTATIDPAAWIEALMNGNSDNVSDMMDELNFGPSPNHPIFNS